MSVKDALEMAKKNKAEIVDFKFIDVPGLWQHFSIPAAELSADAVRSKDWALTDRAYGDFNRSTNPT